MGISARLRPVRSKPVSAAEDTVRILWLAPYFPAPTFGGGTRVFNLIRALAVSCEIDLIAMDEGADEGALRELRSLCRTVEVLPRPTASPGRKRLLQLRSITSRRSAQYWMLRSSQVQNRIDRAARERQYSAVILEHSFLGRYTLPASVPVVLDQHNVESEILRRASEHERSILRRAYNRLEYRKYRAEEQRICLAADV